MSEDVFVSSRDPAAAIVSPLHTITYVTADKTAVDRALREGLDLEAGNWISPRAQDLAAVNGYLGMPADMVWEACNYFRTGPAANSQIRVIVVPSDAPVVRPGINGRYVGGLSIGFPMADMERHERQMATVGIESSVGIKRMEFTSPGGDVYISSEIHFMGPESVFLLGVERPGVFVPVGPRDESTGTGAAAYSARCVDNPEAVMAFIREVLGFEIRRDATFGVVQPSGLKLADGMSERFIQAFAPGASTGYLVLLDHEKENIQSPAPTLGPPSRGVAMWSFASSHFDAVSARAEAFGASVLYRQDGTASPFLPATRSMIITDPGGFPIEIFEPDSYTA